MQAHSKHVRYSPGCVGYPREFQCMVNIWPVNIYLLVGYGIITCLKFESWGILLMQDTIELHFVKFSVDNTSDKLLNTFRNIRRVSRNPLLVCHFIDNCQVGTKENVYCKRNAGSTRNNRGPFCTISLKGRPLI